MKKKIPAKPLRNPLKKFLVLGISTGLGLGFSPIAPGSAGSLLGVLFGLYLLQIPTWMALLICAVLFLIFSVLAGRAAQHWGEEDCQKIVSDEVLGQGITFLTLRHFSQLQEIRFCENSVWQIPPWGLIVAAFIIFRLLDIVKPYPARTFDRQGGGFGIVADDVVAGLYGALVMLGLSKIWHSSNL